MVEKFRSFYINHLPRQQNAHALASLSASLALPTRATKKVLVHSLDIYCPKFAVEDSHTPERELQVNEIFETSMGSKLKLGDSHSLTISYMTYCLMILRRQLTLEEKLISSITMRLHRHYIIGHMTESCFACFPHKEVQETLKEAHDSMCGAHQLDRSSGTDFEDLATISRRLFLTPSPILNNAMPVRSTWLHSLSTRTSSSNVFFMAI